MFGFKRKPGRTALRAGLLTGVLAATSVVGGLGASSAVALETQCKGASIAAEGASLQKIAQSLWSSNETEYKAATGKASLGANLGFNRSNDGMTCNGTQGSKAKPTITYTSSGSGAGLTAFGVNTGNLKEASSEVTDKFIGSDDAPKGPVGTATSQLGEIRTALHKKSSTAEAVVIPVTQTAIAVIANPPASCSITNINNAALEAAFRGASKNTTTWSNIGATPTTGSNTNNNSCNSEVKRVVRADGSGSTYQFKHYLFTINNAVANTTALGNQTWDQLKENTKVSGVLPNTTWPDTASTTTLLTANGGSGVVNTVNNDDGSIAYAALPDAKVTNNNQAILAVQDADLGGGIFEYAHPFTANDELANCSNTSYTKPKKSTGAEEKTLTTVTNWGEAGNLPNIDWSETYGANKNIGSGIYPICTLTWDVAPSNATGVYGTSAATTVSNYLSYVVTPTANANGGQAQLSTNWYAPLPSTAGSNVQEAATLAVAQIK